MQEKLAHLTDLVIDVTTQLDSRHCKVNIARINSEEAGLRAVLLYADWNIGAMLSLSSLRFKDLFYEALDYVYYSFSFFPD